MAWTITTYAGQYAFGTSGALKVGMFELCRAINERETAMGVTQTSFYKADGTQDSDLLITDFVGMKLFSNVNRFRDNCERIMARIKEMVNDGWFTEGTGRTDVWTLANLEADVGLGTFLDAPRRLCDALFYQQCQNALDRLIYLRATANADVTMGQYAEGSNTDYPDSLYASATLAWTNRTEVSFSDTVTQGTVRSCIWSATLYLSPSTGWGAAITRLARVPFNYQKLTMGDGIGIGTSTITGTLTESHAILETLIDWPSSTVSGTVDGEAVSFDAVDGEIVLVSSPTLTSNFTIDVVFNEPSTIPDASDGLYQFLLRSVELYVDIAAELTDQD